MDEAEQEEFDLAMNGIFITNIDNEKPTIYYAKQERTQLEMAINSAIEKYNERTGAMITAIHIKYSFCGASQHDIPYTDIEVKI